MAFLHTVFLVLHIVGGFTALTAGSWVMLRPKGGKQHRLWGNFFYYGMWVVCLSALAMVGLKPSAFLFHISVFVGYQNWAGYRSVQNKSLRPKALDWLLALVAAANGIAMLFSSDVVLMVFGGLSILLSLQDVYVFVRVIKLQAISKLAWLSRHLGMMIGAYIGAFTAFLVVNVNNFSPAWVLWLAPTAMFVPLMRYWNWLYTIKPLQKKAILALTLLVLSQMPAAVGQPYVTGGQTRHRFAQMTVGLETRSFLQDSSSVQANVLPMNGQTNQTRLLIGGTHFWGHADFFVAIPLVTFGNAGLGAGVETGMRLMPWRIEERKIRPFLGVGFQPMRFTKEASASQVFWRSPLTAGFVFNKNGFLIDCALSWYGMRSIAHFDQIMQAKQWQPHPWSFGIGLRYMFDSTLSAEEAWQTGKTKQVTDALANTKRLNGITLAAGVSAAFFTRSSSMLANDFPFLHQHKIVQTFPELGIGYYWHRPDVQINLAYRGNNSTQSGFGYTHEMKRRALTLEAYHFLADYHGFVPFVGLSASLEKHVSSLDLPNEKPLTSTQIQLQPGITFGWDIRPNRLQAWYLRTNLRWFPSMDMVTNQGHALAFDQLEFNFIQLVIFPNRFR